MIKPSRLFRLGIGLLSLLLLSGCWDNKEIQNLNFAVTIGVDYMENQYVVYITMLDFTSIAKQETGKSSEKAKIWVGKGVGKSLNLAMTNLYMTAQQRIAWSHIGAIILHERALKKGESIDALSRYREIRYTPWVFGTRESIPDILSTHAFFNLSPTATILGEPMENYKQKSLVTPIRYLKFIASMTDKGRTTLLPSIEIFEDQWHVNKKPDPKLGLSGVFAMYSNNYVGHMNVKQLTGLRFMSNETQRTPLQILNDSEVQALISIENLKVNVHAKMDRGEPRFDANIKLKGTMVELLENMSMEDLYAACKKEIEREIRLTFEQAVRMQADVYNLEHYLYKQQNDAWKRLTAGGKKLKLTPDMLRDIRISLFIEDSGMLRMRAAKDGQKLMR